MITGSQQLEDGMHNSQYFFFLMHIFQISTGRKACCAFIWLFDSLPGCLLLCHCPRAAAAFLAETSSTCWCAAETNPHIYVLQSGWRPPQPLRPLPHTQTRAAARATGPAVPPGTVALTPPTVGLWTEMKRLITMTDAV